MHVVQGIPAHADLAVTDRQRDTVESVRVGDGIGSASGVVDRNPCQGLSRRDIPDMSAEVDFSAAPCARVSYFIDLVGVGDDGILFREETLEPVIVDTSAPFIEITRRQRSEDGLAMEDERAPSICAYYIAAFAKPVQSGFQKAFARGADTECGLFLIVLYEVYVLLEFFPQEAYERVESYASYLKVVLRRQREDSNAQGGQQYQDYPFHRATRLRTLIQYLSKPAPCNSYPEAETALRISLRRSGNFLVRSRLLRIRENRPSRSLK